MAGALVIRKKTDGSVVFEGGLPDVHTFSARHLLREAGSGLFDLTITVNASDDPAVYKFVGYEPLLGEDGEQLKDDAGNPKWNFTGLVCERVK